MGHIILVGAGFSRNWGGWLATEAFEYLLGCQEIINDVQQRRLLWRHQESGGFEDALSEIQTLYLRDPASHAKQLADLQSAITRMFDDMNRAFLEPINWEFSKDQSRMVRTFLSRFDAIFSLNQDLLLERHYCNANVSLVGARKWSGPDLPGMKRTPSPDPMNSNCWARSAWTSKPETEFRIDAHYQPLIKLHGSSNWKSNDGKPLLVMGGAKAIEIGRNPILSWYFREFEQRLSQLGSKLMVIGYGFRDEHINAAITRGVECGLRIFVIAPEGAELAFKLNPTRHRAQIIAPSQLEETLKQALTGASRRPLRDIFGEDNAEFNKVMRFFEPS